jgi:molecular chaperone HtpG
MFSLRKEDGLQLYSRKILIQEYCRDLLPEYFGFVTGLVDSEDLPLNVSRESVQTNRIMVNLKNLVTKKVIETIEEIAEKDQDKYAEFWGVYSNYIKQGVAIDDDNPEKLYPLLRFKTNLDVENWTSFDDYVARMKPDQEAIYYIMGDDEKSVFYSPHLDIVRDLDYEVLLMTDQIDAFMFVKLKKYGDHELINIANADIPVPEKEDDEQSSEEDKQGLEEDYAGPPTGYLNLRSDW